MNKTATAICWLLSLASIPTASATDLTAVTLFGCDDRGTVAAAFRNNSGPIDAAWDVFLYGGKVFDPASDNKVQWLNDPEDHTIRIPLSPGRHEFTFHCEFSRPWPTVGMNLFLDGANDKAAISVRAPMGTDGPPFPPFVQNSASLWRQA